MSFDVLISTLTGVGCHEFDTDYTSNSLNSNPELVTSHFECQKKCKEHEECKFWTMHKETMKCWLKTDNQLKTYDISRISGPKECAGMIITSN